MIPKEHFNSLMSDAIISYHLRSIDLPRDPQRIWKGRVIDMDPDHSIVVVDILDEGFQGETERVEWEQIVTVELRAIT